MTTPSPVRLSILDPAIINRGRQIAQMMHDTAVGTGDQVQDHLDRFTVLADADEPMVVFPSPTLEQRLAGLELLSRCRIPLQLRASPLPPGGDAER